MTPKNILRLAACLTLLCISPAIAQDDAITVLDRTATRDEQLARARAYNQAGRHYEASKIADRILESNPSDSEAAAVQEEARRALREIGREKIDAALAAASRPEATDQDRLALADAYFAAGDYRAAARIYAKLPSSVLTTEVRLRQARSLGWTGDYYHAEKIYADLLREKSTPELNLEYGRLLSWMGATASSVKSLSQTYQTAPSEDVVVALANARAWRGDRSGAIDLLVEFTDAHPDAAEARLLLDEMQASPELRLERAADRIDLEPYNLALRVERARLLYDAGRYAGALREIEFVRKHSSKTPDGLDELERQARQRRDQAVALLDEQRRTLQSTHSRGTNGGDADSLGMAKAYTGHAAYDQAIDLYEDYLRAHPEDTNARISYARVLSWDKRYSAAQKQYQILLREMPDRADLRYEYAQAHSHNSNFVPAVRTFRDLTDLSGNGSAHLYPDVPAKAHYNLGQIYRWYGWNESAIAEQNRALDLDAAFAPARQELSLARYQKPASLYRLTYSDFHDSNDFEFQRADLEAQRWISQSTAVEGSVGRHHFQRGSLDAAATSLSGGARHRFQDRLIGRGRVGVNIYDEGIGTRPFWGLGVDFLPNLQTRTALDYNHYDLVYDVFTLAALGSDGNVPALDDPLHIDDFRGRLDYRTGGFWSFLGDASYGLISDDNRRQGAHGLLSFRVLRSPFVAIKADARYLSYDFRSNRYWSPTDYHSLAGVLQIGHDIRDRVFWTLETKLGKSYERDRSSDIRTYSGTVSVPVSDLFDIVGGYSYGKSGRFDNLFGGSGDDFVNYWQRRWYVGVRLKQLFSSDDRNAEDRYYYDNRGLTASPVIPVAGEVN